MAAAILKAGGLAERHPPVKRAVEVVWRRLGEQAELTCADETRPAATRCIAC
jgi:hypothetical protein